MLHYYSGPLLFDTTSSQQLTVLAAFRDTVLHSNVDLVVSSSVLQSAWMWHMAGVAVPHVRPHATKLRGLYRPPEALQVLTALVLRSTWVNSVMAEGFQQLLLEMRPTVDFEWLGLGKFMAYTMMAQVHAAVFLPEQPDKLTPPGAIIIAFKVI